MIFPTMEVKKITVLVISVGSCEIDRTKWEALVLEEAVLCCNAICHKNRKACSSANTAA